MNKPLQTILGDQLTVICVLWVSKDNKPYRGRSYNWSWVNYLYSAVQKRLSIPHRFICLSNCPGSPKYSDIEVIPLKHNWPAWWSKIECFRPDIPGDRFLYIDLDNIPIGPLDDLVLMDSPFIGINPDIADKEQKNKPDRIMSIASGVMVWDRDYLPFYEKFSKIYMTSFIGDQDYISAILRDRDLITDFKKSINFETFPNEWIKILKKINSSPAELFKGDCRILCCSPGGWRPDIVTQQKGFAYQWVNELWKHGYINAG